jgi:hypothetical protein
LKTFTFPLFVCVKMLWKTCFLFLKTEDHVLIFTASMNVSLLSVNSPKSFLDVLQVWVHVCIAWLAHRISTVTMTDDVVTESISSPWLTLWPLRVSVGHCPSFLYKCMFSIWTGRLVVWRSQIKEASLSNRHFSHLVRHRCVITIQ